MDRDGVVRHLKAWAEGVDPATGSVLEADHPGQRPDTLRVIFAVLALLEQPWAQTTGQGSRSEARNAGRAWSVEDDAALATAFDAGTTISDLAGRFERTRGSISARLVRLGKAAPPEAAARSSITSAR